MESAAWADNWDNVMHVIKNTEKYHRIQLKSLFTLLPITLEVHTFEIELHLELTKMTNKTGVTGYV